jgi:hypothetical protein
LVGFSSLVFALLPTAVGRDTADPFAWPTIGREARPWAYWWWMASAVDPTNIAAELTRYQQAGMGGVHIVPIYGAKGYEGRFIEYLSPKWMEMLSFTVREAQRRNLGVDMTTGSGWCFGGPRVTDTEANALVVAQKLELAPGQRLDRKFDPRTTQALVAVPSEGQPVELTARIAPDGTLDWSADNRSWQVFAVSQRPSGQKVKRAGPGGQGHMLNLFYPSAVSNYLRWFDEAFAGYPGPWPRAMYHDSYEYRSDWAPDLFHSFEKRRGYRLESELDALFGGARDERAARVKTDYRETVSDVMVEESLPLWARWCRDQRLLTRNEAHGSPGNWLDLYATADIPETEMFYKDRNKLISKFASAAAHVTGKPLVSAETGTWLQEHFTETLADMKYLLDDLFLSGVNHVFYHGTCYSPEDAPWPGWLFYASYEMNPRNSIWRDVPALNGYAARCQAVLQSGRPDNDLLVYWPIHDFWHNPTGMVRNLTVHARDWFEEQPIGSTADRLWNRGYAFDYISDRQLASATVRTGSVKVPGGAYRAVVLPPTRLLPVETLERLLELARAGATVIFEQQMPGDVPGWGALDLRRERFQRLAAGLRWRELAGVKVREATVGKGRLMTGELEAALPRAGVPRERMFDLPGLMCIRRAVQGGCHYFIANRSETNAVHDWVALGRDCGSVVLMDPLSGQTGRGRLRRNSHKQAEVYLDLEPGASVILRCLPNRSLKGPDWPYLEAAKSATPLAGVWRVRFIQGGPELPQAFEQAELTSWTAREDVNAQRFAGTACYTLRFDAPQAWEGLWRLDLGRVCQSARVRLNGRDCGTLFTAPFRVTVPLKPKDNLLEVEVTNVSANRIRDLDRHGSKWKNFYDINFVNLQYKPFDASDWPLTDSGLLGPVTLVPLAPP